MEDTGNVIVMLMEDKRADISLRIYLPFAEDKAPINSFE
jgi:hypothetical protein